MKRYLMWSGGKDSTASIDELYGDSRDDEWKKEEVERLKAEQGIVTGVQEPAVNMDLVE